jgi:hypothetical protein
MRRYFTALLRFDARLFILAQRSGSYWQKGTVGLSGR